LEDVDALARLAEPKVTLERLEGLVVLDEVQRKPELFALLRVLADRKPVKARFLLTALCLRCSTALDIPNTEPPDVGCYAIFGRALSPATS
jgi:hypothetical protein